MFPFISGQTNLHSDVEGLPPLIFLFSISGITLRCLHSDIESPFLTTGARSTRSDIKRRRSTSSRLPDIKPHPTDLNHRLPHSLDPAELAEDYPAPSISTEDCPAHQTPPRSSETAPTSSSPGLPLLRDGSTNEKERFSVFAEAMVEMGKPLEVFEVLKTASKLEIYAPMPRLWGDSVHRLASI